MSDFWTTFRRAIGLETSEEYGERLRASIEAGRREAAADFRIPGAVGTDLPSAVGEMVSVATTRVGGENVIVEFEHGRRKHPLTYPNRSGATCYREGDIVMVTSLRMNVVREIFPELGSEDDDDLLLDLALGFLGESPPEIPIGWKILTIGPERERGSGAILLQGVVFFDDQVVELETRRSTDTHTWAGDFYTARCAGRLALAIPVLEAVAGLAVDAITSVVGGGLARTAARWSLRGALRIGVRRTAITAITRFLARRAVSVTLRAGVAFARGFADEVRNQRIAATLRRDAAGTGVRPEAVRACVLAGLREAISSLFDSMGEALVSRLRTGMPADAGWQRRFSQAVAEEILQGVLIDQARVISTAAIDAANDAADSDETFARAFGEHLGEAIRDAVVDRAQSVLSRPTGAVAELLASH